MHIYDKYTLCVECYTGCNQKQLKKGMQRVCSLCYLLSLWKCILHHIMQEGHCCIEIKTKWKFQRYFAVFTYRVIQIILILFILSHKLSKTTKHYPL